MPFLAPALIAIGSAVSAAATAVAVEATTLALSVGLSAGVAAGIGNLTLAAVPALLETGVLAGVAALLSPHPAVNTAGSPQDFKPNPNAGLPVVMGRYGVGGNLVYETTSGGGNKTEAGAKGNEYLTSFVILSALGPVQAFETLRFNDTILTFDPNGQACNGGYIPEDEIQAWNPGYRYQNADGSYINNNYQDHAWQNLQLGALDAGYFAPPSKLASDNASLPEWTQAHGFSGFCAAALTLVYDQRYYAGGVPQYQWVLQGIKIYDPRLDSTYAGGAGAQRWAGQGASAAAIAAARGTWTFSQNPWIHALNFALGHFLPDAQTGPGRLYAGIGAGVTGVDIPAFVRAANIADANGWLICGQWTTSDGKWSVLTEMAKAGSGSIVIKNGIISCIVDAPLTSLGTVTADDLSGPVTVPTGASFISRLNTIYPRFTAEAHRWQMVQADTPVKAATYVAEDGAVRSKTLDWQYVPAVNQACQCAAYTICNGREIPGIVLPGRPKLRNYDVGDCFTLDVPEAGLATTKVMVTRRVTDWSTGGVTLTVRTETDDKHAYSLGVSGVAPATPGISGYDPTIVEAPLPANWATGLLEASDPITGESRSIIQVTGSSTDNLYAKFVDIRWRPVVQVNGVWTPTGAGSWSYTQQSALQGQYPLDLNPGTYDVQIAYTTVSGAYPSDDADWLDLGIETVGGSVAANTANVGDRSTVDVNTQLDTLLADVAALQSSDGEDSAALAAAVQAAQVAEAGAEAGESGAVAAQAAAGQSASASEGSASTATAQAAVAGESATTAQAWAQQSQDHASNAGTFAAEAQTSATDADASSAAAYASAQLVANFNPGTNLVADPNFLLGQGDWSFGAGAVQGASNVGTYVARLMAAGDLGSDYIAVATSKTYSIGGGLPCSLQAVVYSGGLGSLGSYARVVVTFLNAAGAVCANGGYAFVETNISQTWTRLTNPNFAVPADAASFFVTCDLTGQGSDLIGMGDNAAFQKIKFEFGALCTPFTDDQVGAAIVQDAEVAASATSALSETVETIRSVVDDPSSGNVALEGAITQEAETAANATAALAQTVDTLSATVDDPQYGNVALRSAISDDAETAANATTALAQTVDGLSAAVSDPQSGNLALEASVTDNRQAVATLLGGVASSVRITLGAGGAAADFELLAEDGSVTGPLSELLLGVDKVLIQTPDGRPIMVADGDNVTFGNVILGNITINGALVDNGTLAGSAFEQFALTQTFEQDDTTPQSLGVVNNSNPPVVCTLGPITTMGHPLQIDMTVGIANTSSNHDQDFYYTLYMDASPIKMVRGRISQNSAGSSILPNGSQQEFPSFLKYVGAGAGEHTFEIKAATVAGSSGETNKYTASIRITEFRDQ